MSLHPIYRHIYKTTTTKPRIFVPARAETAASFTTGDFSGRCNGIYGKALTLINIRSCKSGSHLLIFSLRLPIPVLGCEPKK